MPRSEMVQSLQRALDIVEQVARSDNGMRLNELAERLELKTTTVHNLARTLRGRGYLVKGTANRYRLGPAPETIMLQQRRRGILQRAESVTRSLHAGFKDSVVTFSELAGTEIFCRLRMSPQFPGVLQHPQSQTFNAFGSASGLCLQAFNQDYRDTMAVLEGFNESGNRIWKTRAMFERALADTVRRGMAALKTGRGRRLAAPVGESYVLGLSLQIKDSQVATACRKLTAAAAQIAATG